MQNSLAECGFVVLLTACLALYEARAASPQIEYGIEAQAAKADLVVVGHVLRSRDATSDEIVDPYYKWRQVTVLVTEVLKGTSDREVRFFTNDENPDWINLGNESIFCLEAGSRIARRNSPVQNLQWVLNLDCCWPRGPIDLSPAREELSNTLDVENPTTKERVLASVRQHCAFGLVRQFEGFSIPIPKAELFTHKKCSLIIVPVDPATESLARTWAYSVQPLMRWNAIKILRHYKSVANEASIAHIANEPVFSAEQEITRQMAVATLAAWGKTKSDPGPTPSIPNLVPSVLSSLLVVIMGPLIYLRLSRSRTDQRENRLFKRLCQAIWLFVVACLLMLWVRSYFDSDMLVGKNWEFGARNGKLFAIHRYRFDVLYNEPWRFCRYENAYAIRDYFESYAYDRLEISRWLFVGGMDAWGQEEFRIWTYAFGLGIPFWALLLAALFPILIRILWILTKTRFASRARGFEVIMK